MFLRVCCSFARGQGRQKSAAALGAMRGRAAVAGNEREEEKLKKKDKRNFTAEGRRGCGMSAGVWGGRRKQGTQQGRRQNGGSQAIERGGRVEERGSFC